MKHYRRRRAGAAALLLIGAIVGQLEAQTTLEVDLDFYTPMCSSVTDGRDYVMTSNAWVPDPEYGYRETLTWLKFDLANLPDEPVDRAILQLETVTGLQAMGDWDAPVQVSAQNVDEDVALLHDGTYAPGEFQDPNGGHLTDIIDTVSVEPNDYIIYDWDVTSLVNGWIQGLPNYGLALAGRTDDPSVNGYQHPQFITQDGQANGLGIAPRIVLVDLYELTLTVVNRSFGTVTVDPNASAYEPGTEVTLTAEPNEGRSLKYWMIYDPNFPGDLNHATVDANLVTTIVMNSDMEVEAWFTCGSRGEVLLPTFMLMATALGPVRLRRG